jgi:hypothetical protein
MVWPASRGLDEAMRPAEVSYRPAFILPPLVGSMFKRLCGLRVVSASVAAFDG